MSPLDDPRRNGRNLLSRLTQPEDHFRKSLTDRAVMVNPRESNVLERLTLHLTEHTSVRVFDAEITCDDGVEK
jgi:hypothetical protein